MNILPKKKWHVRTKENMARVRRDEAKAAAEEAARAERATLADHEDRVRRLKSRAADNYGPSMFDCPSSLGNNSISMGSLTTHVNLFEELETQERQNLQKGNKEYEAEKKKEYNDWESKMGIMKRFAEDTKEYSKDKYWWECIPLVRQDITDGFINNFAKNIIPNDPQQKIVKSTDGETRKVAPIMKRRICEHVGADASLLPDTKKKKKAFEHGVDPTKLKMLEKKARKKLQKEQHEEKKRQKKERRKLRVQKRKAIKEKSSSPSSSSSSLDVLEVPQGKKSKAAKDQKSSVLNESNAGQSDSRLLQLRAERLKREKQEKERAKALSQPKKEPATKANFDLESERTRKYNTQFNPEFSKR